MKPVIIEYQRDVAAADGRRTFFKGERYQIPSLADARKVHPDATVLGYDLGNGGIGEIEADGGRRTADGGEKPKGT